MTYVRNRWDEWPRLPGRLEAFAHGTGRVVLRIWIVLVTIAIFAYMANKIGDVARTGDSAQLRMLLLELGLVTVVVLASDLAGMVRKELLAAMRAIVLGGLLGWFGLLVWITFRPSADVSDPVDFVIRTGLLTWGISNVITGITAFLGRDREHRAA